MVAVQWRDKRNVTTLSTLHKPVLKRVCGLNRQDQPRVKQVTVPESKDSSPDEEHIFSLGQDVKTPVVKIDICNKPTKFLVDSGATVNVIHRKTKGCPMPKPSAPLRLPKRGTMCPHPLLFPGFLSGLVGVHFI